MSLLADNYKDFLTEKTTQTSNKLAFLSDSVAQWEEKKELEF